jgi:hypothetical protein
MKRSPHEEQLWRNLGPSKFSAEGFLGHDDRPLDEIISADLRLLEELGIAKGQLVHTLRDVYNRARGAFGAEVSVAPDVTATYYESRGSIPSPFRGDGTFEKGEVVVTSARTGQSLVITSLSIHLIDRHDFFQGRGARHRIDPDVAIDILRIREDSPK